MNALFRKELRQVLPVQLLLTLIATAAWFWMVDPNEALAPHSDEAGSLFGLIVLFALVVGVVIGFGQFAVEEWLGTREYLVHRRTGSRQAFRAKVLAACSGFCMLIAFPPVVFGAYHLGRWDFAGTASVLRLVQACLAGCTVFAAYALGALTAQVERGWLVRLAFAGLGAVQWLVLLAAGSVAVVSGDLITFLLSQASGAVLLLWAASNAFHGHSSLTIRESRPRAVLRAAILVSLFLPIFAIVPAWMMQASRISYFGELPHLAEDVQGTLYVAARTGKLKEAQTEHFLDALDRGPVYELVDEHGQQVPEHETHEYRPLASHRLGKYTTVYAPFFHSLLPVDAADPWGHMDGETPFLFSGPWFEEDGERSSHWLDLDSGTFWISSWDQDSRSPRPANGPRWTPMGPLPTPLVVLDSPLPTGRQNSLFVNVAEGRFWTLVEEDQTRNTSVQEVTFPDNDTFLGLEPLFDEHAASSGLHGYGYADLARGKVDSYAWTGKRWMAWSEMSAVDRGHYLRADEFQSRRAWILTPSEFDGIGFQLDVHDAKTGERRMSLDLSPSTPAQRRTARLCEAYGLALPPVVALASWASRARTGIDPRVQRVGLTEMDLLRGQRRTWIPVVLVALAAILVRDLWRRLGQGAAPLELRLWWCGATALLGLPAYVLCRLIEPRAKRAPRVTAPNLRPLPRFEIRTARANCS